MASNPVEIESFPFPVMAAPAEATLIDPATTQFGIAGLQEYWVNKVWDPGGPAWVDWETFPDPDVTGAEYPDPYATGFGGTEGYRIAGRRYR